jgi:hypothetical protein
MGFGPEVNPLTLFAVKRKPSAWFWGEQWTLEVLVRKVEAGEINRTALVRPANQTGGTGVKTAGEWCDRCRAITATTNPKAVLAAEVLPGQVGMPASVVKKSAAARNERGRGWRVAAGFGFVLATGLLVPLVGALGTYLDPPPPPVPGTFYLQLPELTIDYLLLKLWRFRW